MSIETLARTYPRLYHMAEAGSWPSIARYGLLSTSALLDLFKISGEQRLAIEERHRPESVTIIHREFGLAVVRDQKPMSDGGLRRALGGQMEPRDWYRLLNSMVFFWPNKERLGRFREAAAYRDQRKAILTVDTQRLLALEADRMFLSALNSGCTRPFPHPRGRDTFQPISSYPFHERKARRLDLVAEVAVAHSVLKIADCVIRVEEVGGGGAAEVLLSRERD